MTNFIEIKYDDERCIPKRAHTTDAGADLVVTEQFVLAPNSRYLYDTGVAVKIPVGYVGLVFSRSSMGKIRVTLANGTGIIDSDYRGNIKVLLVNDGEDYFVPVPYETKIAQLVITPVALPTFIKYTGSHWNDTARNTGGFGSTG